MRTKVNISTMPFMVILILGFLFMCCKKPDWYDAKPYRSMVVPKTLVDLQAILDNADVLNQNSVSLGEIGSDGYYINDANFSVLIPAEINAYTWSHDLPYEKVTEWNSAINATGGYAKVYYANLVLRILEDIEPKNEIEQVKWNNIKGQALAHRARTFYELSQVFAPVYDTTSAATDLGIPLRLDPDIAIPSRRSTVKETYDQVLRDLMDAKVLLSSVEQPISNLNKTRPTKAAVCGMLARVYLSMEDYENAGINADLCLKLYDLLIDYADYVPLSPIRTFQIFHSEILWHATMSIQFRPARSTTMLIDTNLFNLYANGDLRKTYFFNQNPISKIVTFKGQYSGNSSQFTGLAVDEIYLIRAESYARSGNIPDAMKDLNDLLVKRWEKVNNVTTYVEQTAATSDEALTLILQERRKELLVRGVRWSDLRRLNKDERFKIFINRNTPDGIFTLEPNSYKYTYPIPDDIITITGMEQNPGW